MVMTMYINEERLRSAINTNSLRKAGNELLAEYGQLENVLKKQPRNDVEIEIALRSVSGKISALIGTYEDVSNPAPLPAPVEIPVETPVKAPVTDKTAE
jgi:hypothetical protein